MTTLTLSTQVMAYGPDESPPFNSIVCKTAYTSLQIQIKGYRQTYGAGPAFIKSNGANLLGGWHWKAEPEGTRLTGYYHLTVKANAQNGLGSIYLHTLYNPYGELSGRWLEMHGVSGSVECEIIK